ncbi:unnamed protein product [Protopolystoma xenopodis]|uniref:Uncharacterized protein n=1 Tax=Protopolystoma xenopodis TaxID=117903 RepID=A0A3S5CPD4_9PLAT|nr:unnamed protein product [Protopolystoma xenopodis]
MELACCDRSACKSTQSYLPSRQNSVICQNSNCYRGLQSPCSSSTPFDYRVETYRIRGQCNRPRLSVSGPSLSEARSLTSIDSGVVTNLHSGSNSTHPHVSQANRLTSVYLETTDIQSRPTASDAFRLAHSGITSPDQASIEEEYTEKQTELAAVDEVEQSLEREGDLCDLDLSHPMIASSLASTSLQALTSSHLDLTSALAIEDTCTARLVNSLMSQQRHRSRSAAKHRYRTGSSKLGLPVISPLLLVGPTNRLSNEVTNDPETCCPMCCSLCSPSVPANDFAMDSLLPPPPYNTVTGRDSGHGIPFASNPTPKATSEPHHQLAPSLAVRFEASSHSPASKARRLPTISQSTQAKQVVYAITSGLIGRSRSLASEDTSSIVDSGVSSAYDQLPAAQTGQVAVLENTSRALTSLLR